MVVLTELPFIMQKSMAMNRLAIVMDLTHQIFKVVTINRSLPFLRLSRLYLISMVPRCRSILSVRATYYPLAVSQPPRMKAVVGPRA